MAMKTATRVLMAALIFASGCYPEPPFAPDFPVGEVEGYKPIYGTDDQVALAFVGARPLVRPGKIYVVSTYLLINEKYQGIHVFDNSDPSHPRALGFLQLAGNTEMAVRNNVLYADHLTDLVALDVSDWNNIHELSRLKQEHWAQQVPPREGRYFECPDSNQGIVIGWEMTTLNNPKCFR
jgi:hypothetical protein